MADWRKLSQYRETVYAVALALGVNGHECADPRGMRIVLAVFEARPPGVVDRCCDHLPVWRCLLHLSDPVQQGFFYISIVRRVRRVL